MLHRNVHLKKARLGPWSHESESEYAARVALDRRQELNIDTFRNTAMREPTATCCFCTYQHSKGLSKSLSGMKHVMKGTRSLTRVDVSAAFASSAGPEHRSRMQHQLRSLNDNEDACLPSRVNRQDV